MTELERADAYLRMIGFEELLKLMKPRKRDQLLMNIAARVASNVTPLGMSTPSPETRERACKLLSERLPKLRAG